MRAPFLALALLLAACVPTIPQKPPVVRAPQSGSFPPLAPCALVHFETQESLSDGAHGWFRGPVTFSYTSFLVRHPQGLVLVDASFGDAAAADVDGAPFLTRLILGGARAARPIARLLEEAGVRAQDVTHVLVTHAHWDHTGGIAQLPNAQVVMAAAEADWVLGLEGHMVQGAMPHHVKPAAARLRRLTFPGPAYDGFAASEDVLGDGSIVAVPSAGHTPGSTSYYLNSSEGRRWLFVGDVAWVKEGIEEPVPKGRLASVVSDHDRQRTADVLGTLHAVHAGGAARLVTHHDARTWDGIPRCAR